MKRLLLAAICLLCLGHLNGQTLKLFKPGFQYEFDYKAQALTKLPDNSAQTAGLGLKGRIAIQANQRGSLVLQIQELSMATVNEVLTSEDITKVPYKWEPITKDEEFIKSAIRVNMLGGAVDSFETRPDEPDSVVNIKKGILTALQLQVIAVPVHKSSGDSRGSAWAYLKDKAASLKNRFHLSKPLSASSLPGLAAYDVMEDDVAGKCVSAYLVGSQPWAGNPDANVVNVTKIDDYENCEDGEPREWLLSSMAPYNCSQCDANEQDMVSTVKLTTYNLQEFDGDLIIDNIESNAITIYAPLSGQSDKMETNHTQLFVLRKILPIQHPIPVPISPKVHDELKYTFPGVNGSDPTIDDLKNMPIQFIPLDGKQFPEVARKLSKEIAHDIIENPQTPMEGVPFKASDLARVWSTLQKSSISSLYEELASPGNVPSASEAAQTLRHVVIDTIAMSGTEPALSFLIEKIRSEQIKGEEANSVLMAIASHSIRPIAPLIRQLGKVCESDVVHRDTQTRNTCWLTFAALVDQSCGSEETKLPVTPDLDTFCSDDQAKEFVQVLANLLQNAQTRDDAVVIVYALAQISRDEVVDVLRPLATGEQPAPEFARVLAIYTIGQSDSDDAIDILEPIFADKNETSLARIVSLQGIVNVIDDERVYAKLAAYINNEDDTQVVSFAQSLIEQYANISHPCLSDTGAKTAHAQGFLDDDLAYGIQDSQVILYEDYDNETDTGAMLRIAYAASNQTIIPRVIAVDLRRSVSGNVHKPLSITLNLEGVQSVFDRIIGPKSNYEKLSLDNILRSTYENETPRNVDEQQSKLNIVPRVDEALFVSLRVRVQNTATRVIQIDAKSIKDAIKSALSTASPSDKTQKTVKLNFQKITSAGTVAYQVPSSLGLPIMIVFKSPTIVDVTGTVSVTVVNDTSKSPLPSQVLVNADLQPSVALNLMTSMGVFEPFKKRIVGAGVASKLFATLPFQMTALLEPQDARLAVKVKPLAALSESSDAKIFSYKVKPFTAIYPAEKFQPLSKAAKIIDVSDEPDEQIIEFGEELLGIPITFNHTSDMFWNDQGSFIKHLVDDNSPLSHAMLWWATPDFKHREYQLRVDATQAAQAQITSVLDLNFLPSQLQEALRSHQNDLKGVLAFIFGWTNGPNECELMSHGISTLPVYPFGKSGARDHSQQENSEDHHEQRRSSRQQAASASSASSSSSSSSPGEISVTKLSLTEQNSVNALQVMFDLAINGPVSRSLASLSTISRNRILLSEKIDVLVNIKNPPYTSESKLQICASKLTRYPTVPCDIANSLNPDKIKQARSQLNIEYGPTCGINSPSAGRISVLAVYAKTEEQIQRERDGREWFLTQCVTDYKMGRRISDACITAIENVASLDKDTYTIAYTTLPDWLQNATDKLDKYAKHIFYDQMTNNAVNVHNPEGQIRVEVESNDPSVDIRVFKPKENTFFENIYAQEIPRCLRGLNVRETAAHLYFKELFNGDAPPTCKLMNHNIESFENVTYPAYEGKCKQILTKDCSPSNLFTVLGSNVGAGVGVDSRELEVQVLKHRISAIPNGAPHEGRFLVTIDGRERFEPKQNEPVIIKSMDGQSYNETLVFVVLVGEFLHVRAPHLLLWVTFDGQNINMELSNLWRGKVCGMCGEMDGNSDDPFVGPEMCSYADAKEFAESYTVPGPSCPSPRPSPKKLCPKDSQSGPKSKQGRYSWQSGTEGNVGMGSKWSAKWSASDDMEERSWPESTGQIKNKQIWSANPSEQDDVGTDKFGPKSSRSWAPSRVEENDDDDNADDDDSTDTFRQKKLRSWAPSRVEENDDDDEADDDDSTDTFRQKKPRAWQISNVDDNDDNDDEGDDSKQPRSWAMQSNIDSTIDDDDDNSNGKGSNKHARNWAWQSHAGSAQSSSNIGRSGAVWKVAGDENDNDDDDDVDTAKPRNIQGRQSWSQSWSKGWNGEAEQPSTGRTMKKWRGVNENDNDDDDDNNNRGSPRNWA